MGTVSRAGAGCDGRVREVDLDRNGMGKQIGRTKKVGGEINWEGILQRSFTAPQSSD